MLRLLTLAALLLLALLSTMTAVAVTEDTLAPLLTAAKLAPELHLATSAAVTSASFITVTTLDDELNNDGDCSLREAIQAADTDSAADNCPGGRGGDTVILPAGHYVLTLGQLEITGTVVISGSAIGTTILDADKQGRVLSIQPGATVALHYLDIRNGQNSLPGGYSSDSEEIEGGGVANYGTTWIDHTTIHMNRAGTWPNMYMVKGADGGGIYNSGILTVTNSTISGNTGGDGALIAHGSESPCGPVAEDWAGGEGGGIANLGTLLLENSTVADNTPGISYCYTRGGFENPELTPGKVGGLYTGDLSTTTIRNSIIAGNQAGDCSGEVISLDHNLFQTVDNCTIKGDFVHWAAILNPLSNNSGATLTHALGKNSPAIDAGDCTDSGGITVTVDQRGEPRPQGEGCDIGAYESPFTSTFAISDMSLPLIGR